MLSMHLKNLLNHVIATRKSVAVNVLLVGHSDFYVWPLPIFIDFMIVMKSVVSFKFVLVSMPCVMQ